MTDVEGCRSFRLGVLLPLEFRNCLLTGSGERREFGGPVTLFSCMSPAPGTVLCTGVLSPHLRSGRRMKLPSELWLPQTASPTEAEVSPFPASSCRWPPFRGALVVWSLCARGNPPPTSQQHVPPRSPPPGSQLSLTHAFSGSRLSTDCAQHLLGHPSPHTGGAEGPSRSASPSPPSHTSFIQPGRGAGPSCPLPRHTWPIALLGLIRF